MRTSPPESYAIAAGILILTLFAIALVALRVSTEASVPADTERVPAGRTHDEYRSSISSGLPR